MPRSASSGSTLREVHKATRRQVEGTFSCAPAISGAFAATEASSFSSSTLVLAVSATISASCISSSSAFVFFAARSLSFAGCERFHSALRLSTVTQRRIMTLGKGRKDDRGTHAIPAS